MSKILKNVKSLSLITLCICFLSGCSGGDVKTADKSEPKKISAIFAGYELGGKFVNKGEHIPGFSDIEFLKVSGHNTMTAKGKYLSVHYNDETKIIERISFVVDRDVYDAKFADYINSCLQAGAHKLIFYREDSEDFFRARYEFYDGFMFSRSGGSGGFINSDRHINIIAAKPWYPKKNNLAEQKRTIALLEKYKIGKALEVTEDIDHTGDTTKISHNGRPAKGLYMFKPKGESGMLKDYYIHTDRDSKVIRELRFTYRPNDNDFEAISNVYGVKYFHFYDELVIGLTSNNEVVVFDTLLHHGRAHLLYLVPMVRDAK